MSEQVEMEEESSVVGSTNQAEKKRFEVKKVRKTTSNFFFNNLSIFSGMLLHYGLGVIENYL